MERFFISPVREVIANWSERETCSKHQTVQQREAKQIMERVFISFVGDLCVLIDCSVPIALGWSWLKYCCSKLGQTKGWMGPSMKAFVGPYVDLQTGAAYICNQEWGTFFNLRAAFLSGQCSGDCMLVVGRVRGKSDWSNRSNFYICSVG